MYRDLILILVLILAIVSLYRYYKPNTNATLKDMFSNIICGVQECKNDLMNKIKSQINTFCMTKDATNLSHDNKTNEDSVKDYNENENDVMTDTLFEGEINSESNVFSESEQNIVKHIDPLSDSFLYSNSEMDIIYGESREKESHCACEMPIDDNYYDNGDEEFEEDCDNVPIHEAIDQYNETSRFKDEEQVSNDFDGIYNANMYNIDDTCENKGCTTFATY